MKQCGLLLISKQDIFVDLLNWSRYLGLTKRGGMFVMDFWSSCVTGTSKRIEVNNPISFKIFNMGFPKTPKICFKKLVAKQVSGPWDLKNTEMQVNAPMWICKNGPDFPFHPTLSIPYKILECLVFLGWPALLCTCQWLLDVDIHGKSSYLRHALIMFQICHFALQFHMIAQPHRWPFSMMTRSLPTIRSCP